MGNAGAHSKCSVPGTGAMNEGALAGFMRQSNSTRGQKGYPGLTTCYVPARGAHA